MLLLVITYYITIYNSNTCLVLQSSSDSRSFHNLLGFPSSSSCGLPPFNSSHAIPYHTYSDPPPLLPPLSSIPISEGENSQSFHLSPFSKTQDSIFSIQESSVHPMASSEAEPPEPASLFERLFSRHRELSLFLPFFLGFTAASAAAREAGNDQDRDQNQETGNSNERIVLINPFTQSMVVVEGREGGGTLESLIRELAAKSGQPPASKASMEAMPSVEIGESEGQEGECAICLEEWEVGGVAKEMPCKHRFHGVCIDKWLGMHGSCPVCRYKMPVEEEEFGKKAEEEEEEEEEEGGGGEDGREERRRSGRAIWVSFSFNDRRRSSENSDQATETDSDQGSVYDSSDVSPPTPSHDQEIQG